MKTNKNIKPKSNLFSISNIVFVIIIGLLLIPQTRVTLQVWLHKGLSYVKSTPIIDEDDRKVVTYSDWQLKSDANKFIHFEDTKGKVVFINFWATWCPPCIAEMPSIQEVYEDYKDKVVFIIVTNDKFETVEKFKSKRGFNFEVFNPLSKAPSELAAPTIPRTFIINKVGEIVIDESGALDWNSKEIRKMLDELLSE